MRDMLRDATTSLLIVGFIFNTIANFLLGRRIDRLCDHVFGPGWEKRTRRP
jgi:hypothetical protein